MGRGIYREAADWAFTAPSSVTYHMQHVVLAGVMGHAAMIDAVIDLDVVGVWEEAIAQAHGGRRRGG